MSNTPISPLEPTTELLLQETFAGCSMVQSVVAEMLQRAPRTSAARVPNPYKPASNPTKTFDSFAEEAFRNHIWNKFGENETLDVYGEEDERLGDDPDFEGSQQTLFLVDMIDGSDLAIAGFGHWCSGVVCFSPTLERILFAVVMHVDGNRYFATCDDRHAVMHAPIAVDKQSGPSAYGEVELRARSLVVNRVGIKMATSRICYYGQKGKNIFLPDECFLTALGEGGRLYNFAGNPMMAKLAEGRVDAVFDIHGQAAHGNTTIRESIPRSGCRPPCLRRR